MPHVDGWPTPHNPPWPQVAEWRPPKGWRGYVSRSGMFYPVAVRIERRGWWKKTDWWVFDNPKFCGGLRGPFDGLPYAPVSEDDRWQHASDDGGMPDYRPLTIGAAHAN